MPLLLALVLAAMLLMRGRGVRDADSQSGESSTAVPSGDATRAAVTLTIDFGDGRRQQYEPAPWREGMTALDLTREARREAGNIDLQGSGASAFVASLGGVENEGAGGRNWMYSVNGEWADRSVAVYKLRPGDHVLWTFAPQQ